MPTPPEEITELTEEMLADLEASVGMFILALAGGVQYLARVFLY